MLINQNRFELGDFKIKRDGLKLVESWVDGEEIKKCKEEK